MQTSHGACRFINVGTQFAAKVGIHNREIIWTASNPPYLRRLLDWRAQNRIIAPKITELARQE